MKSGSESSNNSSESKCYFCNEPVDKYHAETWKRVVGFVGGPRKDSMRLREDTGEYAHDKCVGLLQSGQSLDQADMFEDAESTTYIEDVALPDELK